MAPPGGAEEAPTGSIETRGWAPDVPAGLVPGPPVDVAAKPPHVMAIAAAAAPTATVVSARFLAHAARGPMLPPNIIFHAVPVSLPSSYQHQS